MILSFYKKNIVNIGSNVNDNILDENTNNDVISVPNSLKKYLDDNLNGICEEHCFKETLKNSFSKDVFIEKWSSYAEKQGF